MKANKNDLIKIASNYLNDLFINNSNELDLPCKHYDLSNNWLISHEEKDPNNNYIVINKLIKNNTLIAEYKLILTKNMTFVDEFFITHQSNFESSTR